MKTHDTKRSSFSGKIGFVLSAAGASDAVEPEPPQAVMENTIADANAIASTLLFFITFSSLKIIVLFHRP